ncbi:lipoprotein [Liquorilactobacillus uvarum DSM 19971]|uniref:Lipoprotein n=2 Tax=Liquorilactobacillus uvarum TaxID=303240 RepID=A0A0R1Q0C3_9LACO|nr:lipoprotein [Liquorilactobacillus uvarum DSM 19971]
MKKDFERGLFMKKCAIVILAVSSLLLTGCTSQSNEAKTKGSTKIGIKNTTKNGSAKKKSAQKRTSAASGTKDSPKQTARITMLNRKLRTALGNVLLPTADGLTSGSRTMNVRYDGDTANYAIFYSVGEKAKSFNADDVAQETPYAEFTKRTYNTTEEAAQQIEHKTSADFKGLSTIDLDHNIQGYLDARAGQRYLSWNEGNWSLTIYSTAAQEKKAEQMARKTVGLLERHVLPVPRLYGQVSFEADKQSGQHNQTIIWQDEKTVFKLSAYDFETAIKMVASVK